MEQGVIAKQRRNPRFRRHMQVTKRRAHAPFISAQLINKLLPRVLRVDIQPHARDRQSDRWNHHFGFFCRPSQRGSLEQQRHQHHEERDVKEQAGVIQPGHHREHGQNDRHRAAQAHPTDKYPFAQVKPAEWQQPGKH
ncbi:hypothetical protein D3C86_1678200 [compost metagenome]